jgi:hypothetical protein
MLDLEHIFIVAVICRLVSQHFAPVLDDEILVLYRLKSKKTEA